MAFVWEGEGALPTAANHPIKPKAGLMGTPMPLFFGGSQSTRSG